MSKITSIIFTWVALMLLVSCSFPSLDATHIASPQQASLSEVDVTSASQALLPPAEAVKPMEIVRSNEYSEGVVIDHEGNIYFSHGKSITVLNPDGTNPRIWAETGAPNGHKVLSDGTHLVANSSKQEVLHLDANGKILEVVAKEFNGKPLRAPNDLTLDPQGGFYFTDPGGSSTKNPIGTVYYVDPKRKIQQVITGLAFPNGIVLSSDGKRLFIGESHNNRILVYDILAPGKVGPQQVFAELPFKRGEQIDNQPDGMCLDAMNNLYIAHYGMREVQVFNPNGKLIRQYPAGNLTTSNCAFGGSKLDQLFVTGGIEKEAGQGGLFRLDLGVPGLDIRPGRGHLYNKNR
ncbi:gluconolaconase [Fischerella thermalis CCMEE 5282]|uniref:SMP-30/gluconolactonase/LRE family protein n=1 Tax=Fischerella thermalis TaxID=372787 RepID=UPI000C8084BC|nr:SMP-30/gluconolactonase/LRE family protein [Fischerella thermalis]PMB14218.1 gluconolaconase [Fischerella thermalis CCMEE 5282]